MKKLFFIFLILTILSCDEINKLINPSDEFLIDKTISTSSSEQMVESGTELKMIFPANSVKGDFTLKIKKEGSYPTFSIPDAKLGSNTYRIKFSGNTAFASPAKIIINYDVSKVPSGKTASETVKAYICSNGIWKLATYQLDEPNSKIIISISNLETPKTNKDKPELQENEGDVIIVDGYTTIDDRRNDVFSRIEVIFVGKCYMNYEFNPDAVMQHSNWIRNLGRSIPNSMYSKINWSGQNFSVSSNFSYEDTDEWGCDTYYYNISIVGNLSEDGKNIIKVTANQDMRTVNSRNCANNPNSHTITSITCNDLMLIEDKSSKYFVKDGKIFMLSGKNLKDKLKYSDAYTNNWRETFPNSTDHPNWTFKDVIWDYNVDDLPYVMVKFLK